MLLVSNELEVVSACVLAATALLYPLDWQHVFIPAVPLSLINYTAYVFVCSLRVMLVLTEHTQSSNAVCDGRTRDAYESRAGTPC